MSCRHYGTSRSQDNRRDLSVTSTGEPVRKLGKTFVRIDSRGGRSVEGFNGGGGGDDDDGNGGVVVVGAATAINNDRILSIAVSNRGR